LKEKTLTPAIDISIFSPRWGHEDTYTVKLDKDFMEISMGARKSTAKWRERLDPEWVGEPILSMMQNDHIYPPAITQDLFEHVWKEWRDGQITAQEAENALQEFAKWLNVITHAKPDSEFWNKYF